ncbi:hypothetical protein M758_6G174000 [Ceratodon purpureus]|uniref:COBRA-like protein n=1 Tax=Ceratodon purpureus TaxID=3225 RepID=A0A8T0HIP3_CERPU|nr:hypothetical protein KC19_6G181100 [Ceratodon purpureus]KAG0614406.1 hypothetical protein M758_6G174000 [Ceratodon purpureus]
MTFLGVVMTWVLTWCGLKATVTMFNWQQYRHIEAPGWKLSWAWETKEIIWSMLGAQTTVQGDCSNFRTNPLPHCCDKRPVVIDLLPSAPQSMKVSNCCTGGVLPSFGQDPDNALAAFQITVGLAGNTNTTVKLPQNFTLSTPYGSGYTCSPAFKVEKSKFADADGRRFTEAFMTWNVTCSYSQALSMGARSCCVSFSAFYNDTIVPCPECSCACKPENTTAPAVVGYPTSPGVNQQICIDPRTKYEDLPALSSGGTSPPPPPSAPDLLYCTRDMCPVKVHWHVKTNYKEYWRVKITITNRDFSANFTNWNLVLKHPNFNNFTEAFSFKYKALNPYGPYSNDSAMFWGVKYYNEYLLQAGPDGNVQTDLLFKKNADFTLSNGWAFPDRVYFNGDMCVLPSPQDFPSLPSSSPSLNARLSLLLVVVVCVGSSLMVLI